MRALILLSIRSMSALVLVVTSAGAVKPRCELVQDVKWAGLTPFGSEDSDWIRLFPGESIAVTVRGYLARATPGQMVNATLAAELQPCVMSGTSHPEIASGEPLTCIGGITWTKTAVDPGPMHLLADVSSGSDPLPPGEYTLVIVLDDQALQDTLGAEAVHLLRSNAVQLVVGAPSSQTETLARGYRIGSRAFEAGNYTAALSSANDVLSIFPHSVYALWLAGRAQTELGNSQAAIALLNAALTALQDGDDTVSPDLLNDHVRNELKVGLAQDIAELQTGP